MKKYFRILTRPKKSLEKLLEPVLLVTPGQWILNVIVQRFIGVNRNVPWMVHYTSRVQDPKTIQFGKRVWVSFAVSGGCYVQGANGIILGDDTIFGPGVKIVSSNHDVTDLNRWIPTDPIRIGKHCWIGANAVILPAVSLGDRCVVGAGAVVTKSFPAGSVIGGVPARLLKQVESTISK
jgi:acetyltransferase-like isoleucine patch superfamily enzyme